MDSTILGTASSPYVTQEYTSSFTQLYSVGFSFRENVTAGPAAGTERGALVTAGSVVSAVLISACSALGLFGNVVVVLLVYRIPTLRTWGNSLHVNLAVYDLAACLVFAPFSVYWQLTPYSTRHPAVCLFSDLYVIPYVGNLISVTEIAVVNCIRYRNPSRLLPKSGFLTAIVISWAGSAFFGGLVVVHSHGETTKSFGCVADNRFKSTIHANKLFGEVAFLLLFTVSLATIILAYALIGHKIYQQRRVMMSYSTGYSSNVVWPEARSAKVHPAVGENEGSSSEAAPPPAGQDSPPSDSESYNLGNMDPWMELFIVYTTAPTTGNDIPIPTISGAVAVGPEVGRQEDADACGQNSEPANGAPDTSGGRAAPRHYSCVIKRDRRVVKTSLIIVFTLLLFQVPFHVCTVLNRKYSNAFPDFLLRLSAAVVFASNCINPVVYTIRSKVFRTETAKVMVQLRNLCRESSDSNSTPSEEVQQNYV